MGRIRQGRKTGISSGGIGPKFGKETGAEREKTDMRGATVSMSWPIRKKLICLLLIIFLAGVGIIVGVGLRQRAEDIQEARDHAMLVVQGMAAQQEQMASATKTMFAMLAQFPEVRRADAKACT